MGNMEQIIKAKYKGRPGPNRGYRQIKNKMDYTNDKIKLGNRLRKLRIKKGYPSVQLFTDQNNISRPLYSSYESGKGNITYRNLLKITKIMDISLKDFFSEGFE